MLRIILVTILALFLVDQYEADTDILSHLTREVCYDELGCFNAGSPFFDIIERPVSLLPDDRKDINTKFMLFTRGNQDTSKDFSNLDSSLNDMSGSNFNPHLNTKFVVPGFMSHTAPHWKKPLVDALLMADGGNVFLIDWSSGDGPIYEQAVANTRVVGAELALFIKRLKEKFGLRPETVHIIGHSLGSHIAGYAGKRLKNLGRITAMDPAGPYFTSVEPLVRLNRNDALFVDAIHTNAASTRFQGFGLTESIAHFDFFPNGGQLQPGCPDMGHAILSFLSHPSFDAEGLKEIQCNHARAIELFISSITNSHCELKGVLCDSWESYAEGKCGSCEGSNDKPCVPLGMHAEHYTSLIRKDSSLNFYLNTTATEPYCVS